MTNRVDPNALATPVKTTPSRASGLVATTGAMLGDMQTLFEILQLCNHEIPINVTGIGKKLGWKTDESVRHQINLWNTKYPLLQIKATTSNAVIMIKEREMKPILATGIPDKTEFRYTTSTLAKQPDNPVGAAAKGRKRTRPADLDGEEDESVKAAVAETPSKKRKRMAKETPAVVKTEASEEIEEAAVEDGGAETGATEIGRTTDKGEMD